MPYLGWPGLFFMAGSPPLEVPAHERAAVKFSMVGALQRAAHELQFEPYNRACDLLAEATGTSLVTFNDTASREEVLAAFDRALKE
jgi:hypothetical protein